MSETPLKRIDDGFRRVYYGLTRAGNSPVEREFDKLARKARVTAEYVATLISDLEEYGFDCVRTRTLGDKLVEIYVHKDSPKPLRIIAMQVDTKTIAIIALLRIVDPHGGKTDKFKSSDLKAAKTIAQDIEIWIKNGGSIEDI
ncbi:MAG: hypothetical protein FWE46_01610 [Coriobacteriia bacterium]|nr:hypothetical protein [Coriobacteriia bacterium]MCL2536869.1 hypothetical protein [Coriobacteriia bacterium]